MSLFASWHDILITQEFQYIILSIVYTTLQCIVAGVSVGNL